MSNSHTMFTTFEALPFEVLSRIFYQYLSDKPTPVIHYQIWPRYPEDTGFSALLEHYIDHPPERIPTPALSRHPRLFWDIAPSQFAHSLQVSVRDADDHALKEAMPHLREEYVRQMEQHTLIMIDLTIDVLRDPSMWPFERIPKYAANLYIRVADAEMFRLHPDPNYFAEERALLMKFLERFPLVEFLFLDAVSLDRHNSESTDITNFPTALNELRDTNFKDLKNVYVLRDKWTWDEGGGEQGTGEFLDVTQYGHRRKSPRMVWKEMQERKVKLAEIQSRMRVHRLN